MASPRRPGNDGYGCAAQTDWEPDGLTDQLVQVYLGAWTPGATGLGFTNGQLVEPGSKIVLQVHYFTLGHEGQEDQTRVRLRLEDAVDREAWYLPWMNILWPIGGSMVVPPDRRGWGLPSRWTGERVCSTRCVSPTRGSPAARRRGAR